MTGVLSQQIQSGQNNTFRKYANYFGFPNFQENVTSFQELIIDVKRLITLIQDPKVDIKNHANCKENKTVNALTEENILGRCMGIFIFME